MSTATPPAAQLPLADSKIPTLALVGNPNAGKTSLFNRLTGLRAHTANFAGTTVEHRRGRAKFAGTTVELIDLPGLYTLDAVTPDEQVARRFIIGDGFPPPDALLMVVDATNLERNLFLVSQVMELAQENQRPLVVALNMVDLARRHGVAIEIEHLSRDLGCPVVPISARTGDGVESLMAAVTTALGTAGSGCETVSAGSCTSCGTCPYSARYDWAEEVSRRAIPHAPGALGQVSEKIDRFLTHPIMGLVGFAGVMLLTFVLIFWVAQFPMTWIEDLFAFAQSTTGAWIPEGIVQSFLSDGLIAGLGGVLVFLPQICLLFFMLALLEDSGYLARAAFVMDRLMQHVGLPGKAFVPMLSAHACAIPAIMATRVIEDRRDRLATILVLPLMTCSARVPVYALLVSLLFSSRPLAAALTFTGAYALGIVAALTMAWVFKRTILRGETRPLVIELPNYKIPSLRNAVLLTIDRAMVFVKNAGTTILAIVVALWALSTFPQASVEDLSPHVQTQLAELEAAGETEAAENLLAKESLEYSLAGRIGRAIEPVFAPLGFDWKMSIGVVSSFAAREVIVSTLAVLYGMGDEGAESSGFTESIRASTHRDGSPVFTTAACLSLLVFYVLAMQCLPTQVITKRETGSWKWAGLQFGYMTALAYVASLATYQTALAFGLG